MTAAVVLVLLHVCAVLSLLHHAIAPNSLRSTLRSNALSFKVPTCAMSDTPPNATAWIRSRLTALFEDASTQDAFDRAFSPDCEIRLNHAPHPLQAFKDDLAARRVAATRASVAWSEDAGAVISTNDDRPDEPAVVAGALVVTRSLPFRIRVTPAQRLTHIHFSAKIEQDASAQDDSERRRITSFYCTSVDRTPPIHFQAVPRAAQESG